MRTLEVLAAVVGTVVLVSCSSAPEQAAPSASLSPVAVTEAPSPTPTPTEEPIDTATVPEDADDIDIEYVQAVMDDLDEALGGVYRAVARSGEVGEAYELGMRKVYSPYAAGVQSRDFKEAIGVRGLAKKPDNPTTKVLRIRESGLDCVYFTAERHLSPLLRRPIDPVQPYFLALERGTPGAINPTAWVLAMEAFYREGNPPKSVCGGET